MVAVAQLVESRIVIPVVVGSSPSATPSFPFQVACNLMPQLSRCCPFRWPSAGLLFSALTPLLLTCSSPGGRQEEVPCPACPIAVIPLCLHCLPSTAHHHTPATSPGLSRACVTKIRECPAPRPGTRLADAAQTSTRMAVIWVKDEQQPDTRTRTGHRQIAKLDGRDSSFRNPPHKTNQLIENKGN